MRASETSGGLKVYAVAGTYVVLLGFDMPRADCDGLLGFSIHRRDHTENEAYYLRGLKTFATTDPGLPPGTSHTTRDHPIQSFQWADYTAKPGHRYTYTVTALKGTPADLTPHAVTAVKIDTEDPEGGDHDIYFNRGVAASQAYISRFGNRQPKDVPNRRAFDWLSRGLNEALEEFITSCVPGVHSLRVAAYEFNYAEFLALVRETLDHGVDVKVVYDARRDVPRILNQQKVLESGLQDVCIARTTPKSHISHNKFIVKLTDGQPSAVWTGGTNFSEGGIYGHSNVSHVIQDEAVASSFLAYWDALALDLGSTALKAQVETISPPPPPTPNVGTTVLFSPRKNLDLLQWYADLALSADQGLFMTFAFGMNDIFKNVYNNSNAPLRIALMEKATRPMRAGPAKDAEEAAVQQLRNKPENVVAIGDFIKTNEIDGWVKERLSGLNSNVRYIHNKFMLLNALSDDPIVVAGSANFSDASTRRNDENMVVVRGNTRVADIYLGEFIRLYTHHAFRESLKWRKPGDEPKHLRSDDWWSDYFDNTQRSNRRQYFAQTF